MTPGILLGLGLAAAVKATGCRPAKQSVWQMLLRAHLSQKPGSREGVLGDREMLEAVTRLRTLIHKRDSYSHKGQPGSTQQTHFGGTDVKSAMT